MAPELLVRDKKTLRRRFLFAVFPHGCNSDYRLLMDGMLRAEQPESGLDVRTLAATVLFRIPLVREICLWTGCIDARKQTAERIFQPQPETTTSNHHYSNNNNGNISLMVLPGGQMEQLLTQQGREIIYLKKRKGFIRLALQYQVPIVPVYVFGCSDYYATSTWIQSWRIHWLLKYTGMAIPLCWGIHFFCPRPIPTTVVFGKPIVPTTTTSSDRDTISAAATTSTQHNVDLSNTSIHPDRVDAVHAEFMIALQQLFDQHKHRLGYSDRQLEIY
jgi:1-acyl-sn-glycerol-3-phosphate acyltransferase